MGVFNTTHQHSRLHSDNKITSSCDWLKLLPLLRASQPPPSPPPPTIARVLGANSARQQARNQWQHAKEFCLVSPLCSPPNQSDTSMHVPKCVPGVAHQTSRKSEWGTSMQNTLHTHKPSQQSGTATAINLAVCMPNASTKPNAISCSTLATCRVLILTGVEFDSS